MLLRYTILDRRADVDSKIRMEMLLYNQQRSGSYYYRSSRRPIFTPPKNPKPFPNLLFVLPSYDTIEAECNHGQSKSDHRKSCRTIIVVRRLLLKLAYWVGETKEPFSRLLMHTNEKELTIIFKRIEHESSKNTTTSHAELEVIHDILLTSFFQSTPSQGWSYSRPHNL